MEVKEGKDAVLVGCTRVSFAWLVGCCLAVGLYLPSSVSEGEGFVWWGVRALLWGCLYHVSVSVVDVKKILVLYV